MKQASEGNPGGAVGVGGTYAERDSSAAAQRSAARTTLNSDVGHIDQRRGEEPAVFSSHETPVVERIARVLAGLRLSSNARGEIGSAAGEVDRSWNASVGDARAILNALRQPDAEMLRAGDGQVWSAMVSAALGESYEPVSAADIYQKPLG